MESLEQHNNAKPRNYAGYLIGAVIGVIVLAIAVYILSQQPSMTEQEAAILEGSVQIGTPEFENLTKDIIISTSPDTVQSPNAFGSISMFIKGRVRNKGDKVINGLEINVAVVDQFNQVVKEKRVLAVPKQYPTLDPGAMVDVTTTIDGFKREDDRANIRWRVTAIRTQQ
ncbi:MAG: hypothetical protein QUS14_03050 [Pyrinomonadaceae bacterium]|nr:hypothetical protein [Pyrinomonadaceae bacterium]